MLELELHQLDLRYKTLWVTDPGRQSRLIVSLEQMGQQSPILVVQEADGLYVVIDGYRRVAALKRLARDRVFAATLPVTELEALILTHRLEQSPERSVLEEAWLVRELLDHLGLSQEEAAFRLGRSQSWISRRIAVLKALPEWVHQHAQRGALGAHAVTKFLVPMARAIRSHCEQLVRNLDGHPLTSRQLEVLYQAWKSADAPRKEKIVTQPLLFLKVLQKRARADPTTLPTCTPVLEELNHLRNQCHHLVQRLQAGPGTETPCAKHYRAGRRLRSAFVEMLSTLKEKGFYAGPGSSRRRAPPQETGIRSPRHQQDAPGLPEHSATDSSER